MASLAHYAEVQTIPTDESASILFTTQLCAGAVRTDVLHRMMRTIAAFHRVREHRPCRRIAPHVARGRRVPPRYMALREYGSRVVLFVSWHRRLLVPRHGFEAVPFTPPRRRRRCNRRCF